MTNLWRLKENLKLHTIIQITTVQKKETSTTVLDKNLPLVARFGVIITQEKNHEQNFCVTLDNRFDI